MVSNEGLRAQAEGTAPRFISGYLELSKEVREAAERGSDLATQKAITGGSQRIERVIYKSTGE